MFVCLLHHKIISELSKEKVEPKVNQNKNTTIADALFTRVRCTYDICLCPFHMTLLYYCVFLLRIRHFDARVLETKEEPKILDIRS